MLAVSAQIIQGYLDSEVTRIQKGRATRRAAFMLIPGKILSESIAFMRIVLMASSWTKSECRLHKGPTDDTTKGTRCHEDGCNQKVAVEHAAFEVMSPLPRFLPRRYEISGSFKLIYRALELPGV